MSGVGYWLGCDGFGGGGGEVSFDLVELGWSEFWFRIGVIFFLFFGVLMMFLIVGKVVFFVYDLGCWIVKKFNGKGEEEEMFFVNLYCILLWFVLLF